jgi:hypothetical protein
MTLLGGDDIDTVAGTKVPIYDFLQNGWRIKPQEANHTLTVTDGILLVQGGGDPFVATNGSYVVRVNYQQPVQAISFSTSGGSAPTAGEIADAVVAALQLTAIPVDVAKVNGIDIDGSGTELDPWGPA